MAIRCYIILATIFVFSYILEIFKGTYSMQHVALINGLMIAPLVVGIVLYKIKADTGFVKDVFSVGYGLFYFIVLITESDVMHFVYVIPMLCLTSIFHNWKYTLRTSIGVVVIIIVFSIKALTSGSLNIADIEIIVACILLTTLFLIFTSILSEKIYLERLQCIKIEQEKANENVIKIQNIAKEFLDKIDKMDAASKDMEKQSMGAEAAIDEISTGTADVAENIQIQLKMSNTINDKTKETNELSKSLKDKFLVTRALSDDGYERLVEIDSISVEFKKACDTVATTMNELVEKIEKVRATLNLINGVTTQTGLLSLNASIEAARAGESGKGFAVVASQIKKLAEETKEATADIEGIFDELSIQSEKATESVHVLETINEKQTSYVSGARESFATIKEDIDHASSNIQKQVDHMQDINQSNTEISLNIENMSAFTEELFANSEATKVLCHETLTSVKGVNVMLDELLVDVDELRSIVYKSYYVYLN